MQNKTPLITVILPVYNVEKYLAQCLDTLKAQTFRDFEVIAVNDGSTDNCLTILSNYAPSFPQLQIITQRNAGLSGARNTAIDLAKGNYFMFVDSDDFIDLTCLEKSIHSIGNSDLLFFGHYRKYNDHTDQILYNNAVMNNTPLNRDTLMHFNAINPSPIDHMAWGKLYKRELFDTIRYPVGRKHEDLATTYKIYGITTAVSIINEAMYTYRIVEDSIAHQPNPQTLLDKVIGFYEQYQYYQSHFPQYSKDCGDKVIACTHAMQHQLNSKTPEYQKAISLCKSVTNLSLKYKMIRMML